MSRVSKGSLRVKVKDSTVWIDIWEELNKTKHAPVIGVGESIEFGDDVMQLISTYLGSNGYAGLSLADYLDGLYKPVS